jgi:hypothetical protein
MKSIVQLTKSISPDSASFVEKKRVENRLWRKGEFCGENKYNITPPLPLEFGWNSEESVRWNGR